VADGCSLKFQTQNVVLANVPAPVFTDVPDVANPEIENSSPSNATFTLAPGDTAKITLRIVDPDKFSGPNVCGAPPLTACPSGVTPFNPVTAVMPVAAAQQANVNPPPHTPPPIAGGGPVLTILTTALSAGSVGTPYSAFVVTGGGRLPHTWSIVTGALPGGLVLNGSTGEVSGTPTAAGTFAFTVRVQDSSSPQQSVTRNLSITIVASLPAATNLAFTSQPAMIMQGQVISPPVQVQALAADGTPLSGVTVTIALGANPGGAILSGTTTATTNITGHATFSDLSLNQTGSGYTLVASASGAPPAPSQALNSVLARDLIVLNATSANVVKVPAGGGSPVSVAPVGGCGADMAVEPSGSYIVVDRCTLRVVRVSPSGAITVLRTGAPFQRPVAVAVEALGDILVGDNQTDTIYRMSPDGLTVTALPPVLPFSPSPGKTIRIAVEPATGNLIVANDRDGGVAGVSAIRRVAVGGVVSSIYVGSQIPSVAGVAVDSLGNFIVASHTANTVYSVTPAGLVTPQSGLIDNTILSGNMTKLVIDPSGNYYVAVDGAAGSLGPRVLKITPARVISTVAAGGLITDPSGLGIAVPVTPPGFTPTGSMATARQSPSATVLLGGRVLVAGGGYPSAEIYDPATGTFTPTGGMSAPRMGHTATLLPNGKVLIAGGGPQNAELYNPATGAFTPAGNMVHPRAFHTATVMPNGQVLLAGGEDASGVTLASGEVYNPATGSFSLVITGMGVSREMHSSAILASNQFLIAGGRSGSAGLGFSYLSDAYLFDPVALSFNPLAASMTTARAAHTATRLADGRVLLAGGANPAALASAELYNQIAGTFVATSGSMATPRLWHSATRLSNGKVLVLGGLAAIGGPALASAEVYDPVPRTFSSALSMSTARWAHSAVLLPDGRVLIVGGHSGGAALASAELYQPALVLAVDAGTSATFPVGTTNDGFVSSSADPLAPFSGQSVHFRGYPLGGGSSETLVDGATRYLVYRVRLDFGRQVTISSLLLEGAAFNGSQFRVLDASRNVLWSYKHATTGNVFQSFTVNPLVTGQTFYLEEWDWSTYYRYRSRTAVQVSVP
jgi:hypothetical protein